jgi:hypothetical protein
MKKIWEQKDDGRPGAGGHEGGRRAWAPTCAACWRTRVQVHDVHRQLPHRAPDDTRLGQVRNGFGDLIASDPTLTLDAGRRTRASPRRLGEQPRVAVIPLYDPPPPTTRRVVHGTLHVTGSSPCSSATSSARRPRSTKAQVFVVVLKTVGVRRRVQRRPVQRDRPRAAAGQVKDRSHAEAQRRGRERRRKSVRVLCFFSLCVSAPLREIAVHQSQDAERCQIEQPVACALISADRVRMALGMARGPVRRSRPPR